MQMDLVELMANIEQRIDAGGSYEALAQDIEAWDLPGGREARAGPACVGVAQDTAPSSSRAVHSGAGIGPFCARLRCGRQCSYIRFYVRK